MKRMIMDGNMENGAQAPAEEAREKQVTAKEELVRENSVQAEQGGNDPADRYEIDDVKLEKVVAVHALEISELTGKIKGYFNPDKPNARMVVVRDW